jgi:hypothetical protein
MDCMRELAHELVLAPGIFRRLNWEEEAKCGEKRGETPTL